MDINGMRFYVHKAAAVEENIQTELILIFVLEGEMTLTYQEESYRMKQEDVILINPGLSYEISNSQNALYAVTSFSMKLMADVLRTRDMIFYCNSVVDEGHSYQDIRDIFFQLTAEYTSKAHHTDCYLDSLMLKLLDCLVENYQLNQKSMEAYETENDSRMREIMQYILANLDQEISLNELADQMFVSASTLSRIFKKNTGVYFADYVMQLRVKMALGLLKHSEQNMTQIAMVSGFNNSASFNRAFRKTMGITPSEYRDSYRENEAEKEGLEDEQETKIREELKEKGYELGKQETTTRIQLDMKENTGHKYYKPWNKMINIGPMWDLNKANVQFHVLQLNEQLHFKYIRMWNIFSQKMMVSDGKTLGQYNYDGINQVLDFLVQNHLKPFLALGRRPDTALKSDGNEVFFEEQYIYFASKENWQDMVDDFIRHIVERYGQEEVSGWIFELDRDCIHADDSTDQGLYYDKDYDFFDAWTYLYETLKRRIPEARVGGISSIVVRDWKFMADFFARCREQKVIPDFISFIVFPYDVYMANGNQVVRKVSQNEYNEENQIREIIRLKQQTGLEELPIYITEWNNSISNRNYLNDSCFRAAYIVKKAETIADQVDMLGIMGGTDWVSSHMDTVGIVNGGIGLLTKDMIRKPAYFAVDFLNQLGDYLLDKGANYIATRKENGDIYILCFYYSWFKRSYFLQEEDVDLRKCSNMFFEDERPIHIEFNIRNLGEAGEYYIKKRTLNRQNGSILNEWGKFQYDIRLTRQDVKYLQGISFPTLSQSKKKVINGDNTLNMKVTLEPHEISLIHIFCRK